MSDWVCSSTGGTMTAPMPTTTASVATTALARPSGRASRKRRSSTSVTPERYTAHSTAMKTSSSTSTTRTTNQIARAATKSATNGGAHNRGGGGPAFREAAEGGEPRPARRPTAVRGTAPCSAVVLGGRVVVFDQLGLRRAFPQLLGFTGRAGGQEPQLALQVEQLLVGVRLHFQTLELLHQGVARQILVYFGGGDQLALLVLDLLGHALERLEHALVADRRHRLLNALVGFGALLAGDEDVLLALCLLDAVVQLAQRQLELLGLLAMLDPRLVQLHRALRVLVVPQQRLLGEVVAPLLHRQHRPALPILGALFLCVHLRREALFVRDGRRHLLFCLRQLTAHVHDQLVQHLLRVLGTIDQVVDVRPDQRRETVKDSHENPRCAGGASLSRAQLTLPPLGEHALGEI